MRAFLLAAGIFLALCAAAPASALPIEWKGATWDTAVDLPTAIGVDPSGYLWVQPLITTNYGRTYTQVPGLAAAPQRWVQATFLYNDAVSEALWAQLWVQKDVDPSPLLQVGKWSTLSAGYGVNGWRVAENNGTATQLYDFARPAGGEHTVKIGRMSDGRVDYWLDGQMIRSARVPDFTFDWVELAALDRSTPATPVVFTDFQYGTDYTPEPATLGLLAVGGLVGALRRRRRRS